MVSRPNKERLESIRKFYGVDSIHPAYGNVEIIHELFAEIDARGVSSVKMLTPEREAKLREQIDNPHRLELAGEVE